MKQTPQLIDTLHKGLCSSCIHASYCMYLKKTDLPVWQCEEFEETGEFQKASSNTVSAPKRSFPGYDNLKGLCMDCKNRKTCMHEKPEEGIWRCEDYE